ncbi:site-specific DNA-methyltransferase [Bradyrhizobium sp. P5_C11_2]
MSSHVSPIRTRHRAVSPVPSSNSGSAAPGSNLTVTNQPTAAIQPSKQAVRKRGRGQVERLAANIERFGCLVPILVTGRGEIIDGHAIYEACRRLGHTTVATIIVDHLSEDEVRALRLSLNRITESSSWDPDALKREFTHLLAFEPDLVAFSGFDMPEIDLALSAMVVDDSDPADAIPELQGEPVSRTGDLWVFGEHKLLCGNAREPESYAVLLAGQRAQKVTTDPPYGCSIRNHVSSSHGEFVEGSGMSEGQAEAYFESFLDAMIPHVADGAIVEMFIDWRGMQALVSASRGAGLQQLTTCVWDKGLGGMGSLYRQQAEFVLVMKCGAARHINNVALGRHGRNRTTIWSARGLNGFGPGREAALALHPTVKPVGLIAEALLDTSLRGGRILDPFCGSGTTLLACHRTGRIGYGIELDPAYVDVAVRRMEALTGSPARHAATGLTFAQEAERRAQEPKPARAADAVAVEA